MKILPCLLSVFLTLNLTACLDSDDDETSDAIQTKTISTEVLDEAVAYMDESLPEYGSASVAAYFMTDSKNYLLASAKQLSPFPIAYAAAQQPSTAVTATLSDAWDGAGAEYLISPPGGFPQTDETYPGTTDDVEYVNLKEYLGKQLESDFSRQSGDGEGAFKPTIFGRLDGAIDISGLLVKLLPDGLNPGENTVYVKMVNDEPTATTSDDADGAPVNLTVVDVSGISTLYDVAIYILSTQLGVEDRVWLRNTSTELNFQQLEYKIVNNDDDDSIPVASGDIARTSVNTLNWNRASGEMLFEYVSLDDEDEFYDQGNGSAMRLYIENTGGEAHLISFEGDVAGGTDRNQYKLFSISTEGGDSATEALISVNFNTQDKDQGDYHVKDTDFCVSMSNGDEVVGCTGLSDAELDFSSAFPAFITNFVAMDEADDLLDSLGVSIWNTTENVTSGSAPGFTSSTDIGAGLD